MPRSYARKVFKGSKMPYRKTGIKKVWKAVRKIKSKVDGELKQDNTTVISAGITTTPVVANMVQIPQSVAVNDRVGLQILLHSIRIHMTASMDVNNVPPIAFSVLRIVIVRDTEQVAGTAPAWTDVFDAADVNSLPRISRQGRFKMLFDRRYTFNQEGTRVHFKRYFLRPRCRIRWNDTGANDLQKNGIYVMAISDQTAAGDAVNLNFLTQSSFYDN